ncbi:MAG: hypothetical protein JXB10_05725 [Pirellulales bacterium]|nr:hypothetical protein [Pirellulales bacterium]
MLIVSGLLLTLSGCGGPWWAPPEELPPVMQTPPGPAAFANPALIPITDPQCAWEVIADVVDDYYTIEREEPVRMIGNVLTQGRLDTLPSISPTILEPWRKDAVGPERIENTLQTMRRRAVVQVYPDVNGAGYWVDVAVFKELEDLRRPEQASAGAATLSYDSSLDRVENPIQLDQPPQGWIPQGRDPLLEQRILEHLIARANEVQMEMLPVIR